MDTKDTASKSTNTEGTDTNGARTRLVHGKTTHSILSAASRVHSRLGPGLLERPYRECLRYELLRMGAKVECEKILPVVYEGIRIEIGYRIDMLVDDAVIVEIKSVESILPVHESQLLTYLRLDHKRVGLLLNFNVVRLREGIRRRILGYEEDRGSPLK
jgi:GxxExxY protein